MRSRIAGTLRRRFLLILIVLIAIPGVTVVMAEVFARRILAYCGQLTVVDPFFSILYLEGAHPEAPTSLQFGPDNRLYVSQQHGLIQIFTVSRRPDGDYEVVESETVDLVQQIANHDDNGKPNPAIRTRLVTGLLVAGTAEQPVVYVSSSDPRIGDSLIDTNSGVISRLTREVDGWKRQDLVRGLPRSRQDHAPHGLQLDEDRSILYLSQGSNTNAGAPSDEFLELPEYALSGAVLSIDLARVSEGPHDLLTLDDEDRPGNPDENDPFGGNGGKNQAMLTTDGPVQVLASGLRNAYDLVLTEKGFYLVDNGPNQDLGGTPHFSPASGKVTNDIVNAGERYPDDLHFIPQAGYYAGHPNPTRANKENTFNERRPQSPIEFENPIEARFLRSDAESKALATFLVSTNGITDYRFPEFGPETVGNLLTVSMNARLHMIKLDSSGLRVEQQSQLLKGGGAVFLDVTAQGEHDPYPGTIWIADWGLNQILVLQPVGHSGFLTRLQQLSSQGQLSACDTLYHSRLGLTQRIKSLLRIVGTELGITGW